MPPKENPSTPPTILPADQGNDKLRVLLDNIEEAYYEVDLKGKFTYFNQAACRILGYSAAELMNLDYTSYYVSRDDVHRVREAYSAVLRSGEPNQAVNLDVTRKDGARRTIETSIHLMQDEAGKAIGFRGITRDITERIRSEESLRHSEERFRSYFELSLIGMAVLTPDRRWSLVNDKLCEMLGYSREELCEMTWIQITHPDDLTRNFEALNDAVRGKTDGYTIEKRYIRKNGTVVHAQVSTRCIRQHDGSPEYFIAQIQDISERIQAEEERQSLEAQVLHAQKLESLGVLAGGIAHDFNNLLMGVMGNAGLALIETAPDSPIRRYIEQIETAAMRAADLTKQMLAYSGKGKFVVLPLSLSALVQEMGQLLTLTTSKKAIVEFRLERSVPPIDADASQLRQVVMNLITNASEALDEKGGLITVATGSVELDRDSAADVYFPKYLAPGHYVFLEVSDTGAGMDEQTQARIFDPFFSTKFTGRGLGLAAVQGIVRGHHGAIKLTSGPNRGTSFKVFFPAAVRNQPAMTHSEASPAQPARWTGHGAILVVDDEEMVQAVTKQTLERYGFSVISALDGHAGLAAYREHHDEIAAVILDLTMPVLSGAEAYHEFVKIDPNVRIILSSGYSELDATRPLAGTRTAGFVQKPYSPTVLIEKLRALLEETGP